MNPPESESYLHHPRNIELESMSGDEPHDQHPEVEVDARVREHFLRLAFESCVKLGAVTVGAVLITLVELLLFGIGQYERSNLKLESCAVN
jgi:hypothetical protein